MRRPSSLQSLDWPSSIPYEVSQGVACHDMRHVCKTPAEVPAYLKALVPDHPCSMSTYGLARSYRS